ncbi:MAG TPA: hypothetical protein VFI19_04955 [Nocardioides sp.]|nr:hypothetical protein [Nocardioides sp.]
MDEKPEQGPEQQPAASGNRWEPTAPDPQLPAEPEDDLRANPYAVTETTAAAPPSRPTWLTRARAGVAAGAAAVLMAVGLGGFAIGRATAGPDGGSADQQGVPTGFDRGGDHGFPGGPGGPQLGQLPEGGQVPDMPGQDDGQQDDDGTDGSTT